MTGLVRRVAKRQVVPGSAGAQNPQHAVEHRARVLPRPAPAIGPPFGTKQRIEHRPLGVGEVHASGLRDSQ